MSRDSCDMVRIEPSTEALLGAPAGAFFWGAETQSGSEQTYRVLWHKLPNGWVGRLPIAPLPSGVQSPSWQWDGNEDKPTITPSVLTRMGDEEWHGFFTAGRMVSC